MGGVRGGHIGVGTDWKEQVSHAAPPCLAYRPLLSSVSALVLLLRYNLSVCNMILWRALRRHGSGSVRNGHTGAGTGWEQPVSHPACILSVSPPALMCERRPGFGAVLARCASYCVRYTCMHGVQVALQRVTLGVAHAQG